MTKSTRVLTNVGIVTMVAILFAGCSLIPGSKIEKVEPITVNDDAFTVLSDDDSLETIESEIDSTMIEDEDLINLEADLELVAE